jgi:hypothetical protein
MVIQVMTVLSVLPAIMQMAAIAFRMNPVFQVQILMLIPAVPMAHAMMIPELLSVHAMWDIREMIIVQHAVQVIMKTPMEHVLLMKPAIQIHVMVMVPVMLLLVWQYVHVQRIIGQVSIVISANLDIMKIQEVA